MECSKLCGLLWDCGWIWDEWNVANCEACCGTVAGYGMNGM